MTILHAASSPANPWSTRQVYGMAVGCLFLGLVIGYLFRGPGTPKAVTVPTMRASANSDMPPGHPMPSMEQMKATGDKQAAPLLEKLREDPNNPQLLSEIGTIYKATHQFKDAQSYYQKAVEVDPQNSELRGNLAACLYYDGDVDGATDQLQQALKSKPNDANSLFNLGVMKWQGKNDTRGAIAVWRQLLESNPKLEPAKRAQVEQMIAEVAKAGQPYPR